jgi:hypothetical protein
MSSTFDWIKKMAAKQVEELLNNPAHQVAMNFFEELERNPALKMIHKQMSDQARNPLFEVSGRAMRELDRLMAGEHLRVWERQIGCWPKRVRGGSSRSPKTSRKPTASKGRYSRGVTLRRSTHSSTPTTPTSAPSRL